MNEVAGEGHQITFLDVDVHKDLAKQYNVRSVPTTIIEENGVEVDRFVGAITQTIRFYRDCREICVGG